MFDRDGSPRHHHARGQSELVGFLLIFSVVIITIALVGLTGFIGLDSAQDFQRTTSAEHGFAGVADDIDAVVAGMASLRDTEVRIADARLALEPTQTVVTLTDAEGNDQPIEVEAYSIEYETDRETTITYRHGALIRADAGSPVMFREPSFVLSEDEVVLPLVDTTPRESRVIGGRSSVDVRSYEGTTTVAALEKSIDTMTIEIETNHPGAWERYFAGFEADGPVDDIEIEEETVTVTISAERATVTVHEIGIEFR